MDLESGAAAWRPVAIWWWHGGHMLAAWWRVALWRPVAASFPNDALKVALFWLYGGCIVALWWPHSDLVVALRWRHDGIMAASWRPRGSRCSVCWSTPNTVCYRLHLRVHVKQPMIGRLSLFSCLLSAKLSMLTGEYFSVLNLVYNITCCIFKRRCEKIIMV